SAAGLYASASAFSPFNVAFRLQGPAKLTWRGSVAMFDWTSFDGTVRLNADAPDMVVRAQQLRVESATGDAAIVIGSLVQEFGARIQKSPDRAPGSDAQALTISVDGVKAPILDEMFGDEGLLSASMSATILNAGAASAGTVAQRLDSWSASGGRV